MNRFSRQAAADERQRQLVAIALRAREDDRSLWPDNGQQVSQNFGAVVWRYFDRDVLDSGVLHGVVVADQIDFLWVGLVLVGDPFDPARHRGAKQHRLLLLRRGGQDCLDLLLEAHAQHLVGFVQHDDFDSRQIQITAL